MQELEQQGPVQGKLHFVVDSALLFQLGEELVRKRTVALAELIKNAFDADATNVAVKFDQTKKIGGTITVADDGVGMSFGQVESTWMRIATAQKQKAPSSRFGRTPTGAKGIGRFAASRLARRLEMSTVAAVDTGREQTSVEFNWDEFVPGVDVHEVALVYRRHSLPGHGATGTTLRLVGTREAWLEDDLKELSQDLGNLVAPASGDRANRKDPGFSISIQADEFPQISGDVREASLAAAFGVLDGSVNAHGQAAYSVQFRNRKPAHFRSTRTFKELGKSRFKIHFFVYKKDHFAGMDVNVVEAKRRGREEGGVHVYVDRFRVAPYGNPGDDWLGLDEERGRRLTKLPEELTKVAGDATRPMLLLPGNNQLFGRVFLSRTKNARLRQTLNREGFLENAAFAQLQQFVRGGIDFLTVAYARLTLDKRETPKPKSQLPAAKDILESVRESIRAHADSIPADARHEILQELDSAQRRAQTQAEETIAELSMLRVLASTGTMLVVFQHQIQGILSGLDEVHSALKARSAQRGPAMQEISGEISRLGTWIESVEHQGTLLGLLISRKARSNRRRLPLMPAVENIKNAFSAYCLSNGIKLKNLVPPDLKTPPMYEAELSAILINLLSNAFKAVRSQSERRVAVDGVRRTGETVIVVSDSGIGAKRDKWTDYFKPFVGESEPDPILGAGTGLGLKIVQDFADSYGGEARFVPPTRPWRTQLEVVLPDVRSSS